MEAIFYLILSLKTPTGYQDYGRFFLGNDRQFANDVFQSLSGNAEITANTVLHIDFMETVDELPLVVKTITCTLDELAENVKIIAKETFKLCNLNEM